MSPSIEPLRGQTCLVTGATQGIGREIALGLADRGAHVVLVGRDPARGRAVVDEIAARPRGAAELLLADLSSQRSIHELAAELRRRHGRLHVLVNNAGALFPRRQVTEDGLERTMALNHLGYFLLTELLLDLLIASAPARIINVASQAHARGRVDLDDLQGRKHYGGLAAYRASKLENLYFTYELARRLVDTGVTVNAMHPGTVATRFGLGTPGWFAVVKTFLWPLLRTTRQGAETALYLASSPAVEGVSGRYFVDCRAVHSSARSYDRATQRQLWEMTERLAHLPSAAG